MITEECGGCLEASSLHEGQAEAGVLIDGKRYNVAKVRSRLKWTPKFTHFSSLMAEDYVIEGKVSIFSYPNH